MRIRLNKTTLSQMPEAVRQIVTEWQARYRKATISVENHPGFYASEDAKVTMINLGTGRAATAQAAGEFAGMTRLSPCDVIPLPVGVVAIEQGFFCGTPFLTVHQGSPEQIG
jgi:hypothetical protein